VAKKDYFKDRDNLSQIKLEKLIGEDLPAFCDQFFLGIESKTTFLTRLNYGYDLRIFFDYLVKKHPHFKALSPKNIELTDLELLTTFDIEKYLSYLNMFYFSSDDAAAQKKHTNKERGKARKISAIRVLFKYFFKKDLLKSDIASKIEMPKIHDKEIVRLETDEVARLLDGVESGEGLTAKQKSFHNATRLRDLAMLTLFLGTGIRISECVGLNIHDVDFVVNGFNITRKGGNRVTLYFSDEVADVLKRYLAQRGDMAKNDETALFLSLQNKRISTRTIQELVKKYSRIVTPLKKITPHKLRSTYGTALYRETHDIYIVADVLGHKDVNTTKKHYAAISEDLRKSAAQKVVLRNKPDDGDKSGTQNPD
jgi:site-specific recombinase XerD